MIDFNAIKTSFYQWATSVLPVGTPVIYLFENAPRPKDPYVTLHIQSFSQIGWDYVTPPLSSLGSNEILGDRELTLSIQAYGSDAMALLEILRISLQKDFVLDSLRSSGVAFVDWGNVADITALVDSRFEKRAALDLFFRVGQSDTDNVGAIESVELQEIYKDSGGNIVSDQTTIIP